MSITVPVQGQLDNLRAQLTELFNEFKLKTSGVQKDVQTTNNQINKTSMSVHRLWSETMHISSLIMSNLARVTTNEQQLATIRDVQFGIQIAQTESSVVYAGYRAMLSFSEGNTWAGIYQLGLASMLQIQAAELVILRENSKSIDQDLDSIADYMRMYS